MILSKPLKSFFRPNNNSHNGKKNLREPIISCLNRNSLNYMGIPNINKTAIKQIR